MEIRTAGMLLLLSMFLIGCDAFITEDDTEKTLETLRLSCIQEAGTYEVNFSTLEGCQYFVCLLDNGIYEGSWEESKLIACRTVVLQESIDNKCGGEQ